MDARKGLIDLNCLCENRSSLITIWIYIRSQWIDHSLWTPQVWSVFMQPMRMNNDTDGWYRRLKQQSKEHLNLYVLIQTL
jgi:hypothetical protein